MNSLRFLILIAACTLLSACGGGSTDRASTRSISIPFEAVAGATAISCDASLQSLGLGGSSASLADFKLFVHDVRLVTDEGAEIAVTLDDDNWQTDGIALLDFQDKGDNCNGDSKPVNTRLRGSVPNQSVVIAGIRFRVGVPSSHNHNNVATAPAPLNLPGMFWNWQGGYKHLRFDVQPQGGVARPGDGEWSNSNWNIHLGATHCSPDPRVEPNTPEDVACEYNNRPDIDLTGYSEGASVIRIDYAALVIDNELSEDEAGAPGCMSGITDPECINVFDNLGLTLGTAAGPASEQSVFSVVLLP